MSGEMEMSSCPSEQERRSQGKGWKRPTRGSGVGVEGGGCRMETPIILSLQGSDRPPGWLSRLWALISVPLTLVWLLVEELLFSKSTPDQDWKEEPSIGMQHKSAQHTPSSPGVDPLGPLQQALKEMEERSPSLNHPNLFTPAPSASVSMTKGNGGVGESGRINLGYNKLTEEERDNLVAELAFRKAFDTNGTPLILTVNGLEMSLPTAMELVSAVLKAGQLMLPRISSQFTREMVANRLVTAFTSVEAVRNLFLDKNGKTVLI